MTDKTFGIDVSVWQDDNSTPQSVDFAKARAAGVRFAGIKVSQANWADPDYMTNWANARQHVYRMPYHFLTWDVPATKQAEIFWRLIEKDTFGVLPLMCDFEWWRETPSNALDILYTFLERLKHYAAPLPIGIYTAKSFWEPLPQSGNEYWKQYHLWICDIVGDLQVPKPWDRWTFWQYTFKLNGPQHGAESKDLDGDWYNGTLEQMIAEFNLPELPLPQQPSDSDNDSASGGLVFETLVDNQNVRRKPSTSAAIVRKINAGTIVTARDVGGSDVWIEIAPDEWIAVTHRGKTYARKS